MYKGFLLFYLRGLKQLNTQNKIINFAFLKYKEKAFLIQADTGEIFSFGKLKQEAQKLISFFTEKGIGKGDTIAFSAGNSPEYFYARIACHYSGAAFIGLPLTLTQEAREHLLDTTNAALLITKGQEGLSKNMLLTKPKGIPTPYASLNVSSSSTQRLPKIIQLSDTNWVESFYNYLRNSKQKIDKKTVFLSTLPLVTAGSTSFLPFLISGKTNIITKEDSKAEILIGYIQKYKVTHLVLTPSRLLELLELCKIQNQRLKGLESIITGTERFPWQRLKEAIDFFGPIISVGYGMVEALPPIALLSPQDYNKIKSVGRIAQGVEVKISDDGRIAIKSKTVAKGYLGAFSESQTCFQDGWFYSNDYGYIDQDNFLYILGRKEEILSRYPRMIFAQEVEESAYTFSFVNRAAAFVKNERIFIFISLRSQIPIEEAKDKIITLFKNNFGEFLKWGEVIIKDALPINSFGKLDRRKMEEQINS